MNQDYHDALATHGASLITHIALLDSTGSEVGDGRKAVTWTGPSSDGTISPDADLEFAMTSGEDVAEWRGYSAATGGTDYGGAELTPVSFSNDGTYTLQAAGTSIVHADPA